MQPSFFKDPLFHQLALGILDIKLSEGSANKYLPVSIKSLDGLFVKTLSMIKVIL